MNALAHLNGSGGDAFAVSIDRCCRGPVQGLLQQGLLRGNGHVTALFAALLELRFAGILQLQLAATRQEEVAGSSVKDHRLVAHHGQLKVA
ncbi:hypothetical protein D3C86_1952460 [compost metagenome]